jgi:branched-chain amino acid transport system substrate-binding protein
MKKTILFSLFVLVLVALPLLGACTTPTATETLKIGVVCWLGWPNGLDMKRGIEVMADMDNAKGGIKIGGELYKVEIIAYDTQNVQTTEVAAVNRLVYEDQVKFIMCDGMYIGAWLKTTDAEKVIEFGSSMDYHVNLDPKWSYSVAGMFGNPQAPAITGWLCENYPDLVKGMVCAYPDDQWGHMAQEQTDPIWQIFGVTPTDIFYPADATDLSSLGTRVKTLNPPAFTAVGGGPIKDAQALKAAYDAGYRGQLFANSTAPALSLTQLVPAEALEGFINAAWPVEFDPAPTDMAQEFKDAWIAKYGTWEGPEVQGIGYYSCLKTALQKAGTMDTDEVMAVICDGMEYEAPTGVGKMIARPDIGNYRTVDSIATYYMKKIIDGKPTILATISIDEGFEYFQMVFPPMETESP